MASPSENQKLVNELFEAALKEDPARRPALLQERCQDANVRAEVEKRLADYEQETLMPPESLGATGEKIGPYYLIEGIGVGGMGEVWLAERKEPVRLLVAIKLIKPGMDTREVLARFASERQALALMNHPAIAKVFDAGSTPQGRPYFAMEYVAGTPITTYCDRHKLTMRQRMELFIQVCDGVQHAHQKAIIHRDLKPSNILVTEVDGKPMPKIIDFGLAKAISQRLTDDSVRTQINAILGTIEYMSPEQAKPGGEDIDTRTDVYSLGVVLYQLLAGALPLDFEKLAYQQIMRMLQEQDAPPPSSRVLSEGSDSAITARNRGTDPPSLTRQLRGDPDAVVLKALEKDRNRRYASPSELAADLGRYLRNEPVSAHPPSAVYRLQKYIRRHRLGVAIAAAAVLALVVFSVTVTVQGVRIAREKGRADQNLALAEKAVDESLSSVDERLAAKSDSLIDGGAYPFEAPPDSPEMLAFRNQLQNAAQGFYLKLSAQNPGDEKLNEQIAMARARLGDIDRLRGDNEDAIKDYNDAIALFGKLSDEYPANSGYRQDLAYCHNWIGETIRVWLKSSQKPAQYTAADAEHEYNEAIEIQQKLYESSATNRDYQQDLARSYYNRGLVLYGSHADPHPDPQRDYQQAIHLLKGLVESESSTADQTSNSPEPKPEEELARVYNDLGEYQDRLESYESAVQSFRLATKTVDELLQKDQTNREYQTEAAIYYDNLASGLRSLNEFAQARQAIENARQLTEKLAEPSPALDLLIGNIKCIQSWIEDPTGKCPNPVTKK